MKTCLEVAKQYVYLFEKYGNTDIKEYAWNLEFKLCSDFPKECNHEIGSFRPYLSGPHPYLTGSCSKCGKQYKAEINWDTI